MVAYPPVVPPATRTDSTTSATTHATDHNELAAGLQAIIDILGADPEGGYADLTARLSDILTQASTAAQGTANAALTQVAGLVAASLATNPTPANAAAAAVANALATSDVLVGTDARAPKIKLGGWAYTALGAVVDNVGRAWASFMPDGTTIIHKLSATKATLAGAVHSTVANPNWQTPYLAAMADSVGRAFMGVMPDGTVHLWNVVVNKTLTLKQALALGASLLNPNAPGSILNPAWAIADPSGRAWLVGNADGTVTVKLAPDAQIPDTLRASTEVAASRGSRTGVNLRVGSGLNAYGFVKGHHFRDWDLKWTRMLTRRLLYGVDTPPTQFDILLIGDSYTQATGRWSGAFWFAMKTLFGDAGVGWVGFCYPAGSPSLQNGSVRSDTSATVTGTWTTANYQGAVSPDLGEIVSSTAGDTIVVNFPAGQASAKLYYKIAAGASITAQFDAGGAIQTVDLSVAGSGAGQLGIATLTPPPVGAAHLTLTVVSGTVTLCGADLRKTTAGIRVHKVASTGSRAAQWAAVDPTSWCAGIRSLAPQLVVQMLGTNDQAYDSPAVFAAHQQTIMANLNTALGATAFDGLLAMPAENQRGLPITMASYSAACQALAESNLWCFADMQPLFGVNPADYAAGSARPWYSPDNVHPDPATGGRLMTDAIFRLVAYS